jgi:preprotein translocase subunit SecG
MSILTAIAVVIQVLSAIGVIVLVLLQHGKGADMGAAFGSGSSGSLFGATGSANFLSRMTAALAAVFFVSTLALAFVANSRVLSREPASVMDKVPAPAAVPAAPSSGAAGPASIPGASVPATSDGAPAPAAVPAAAPTPDATQKNDGAGAIPK